MIAPNEQRNEWLETDGLGGFASGTVSGIRTRRYHALLLTATTPLAGRVVLVNGFDAWLETSRGKFAISSQRYGLDYIHPDGVSRLESFNPEPWPRWRYRIDDCLTIEQELFVPHGMSAVALSWKLLSCHPERSGAESKDLSQLSEVLRSAQNDNGGSVKLIVRPFFSGRDFHSMHHENGAFGFSPVAGVGDPGHAARIIWQSYAGLPAIIAQTNGRYTHAPDWYRNFGYDEERARGLDFTEDLASPGTFEFELGQEPAVLIFAADGHSNIAVDVPALETFSHLREQERARRASFPSRLERSADAYIMRRREGKTIAAGFPWFGDWGRDSFIAIRGLCLATGRLTDARDILVEWSGAVSEGMLPNRFPDGGEMPEFNSVDASLWYVIAVGEYLQLVEKNSELTADCHTKKLRGAIEAILRGYAKGTRFNIHADADGLLVAGEPGYQLTWMDARVEGREITPRIGKPIEIQALWLNALAIGARFSEEWNPLFERGCAAFQTRFWNEQAGHLYDVVDCNHEVGVNDLTFRPNQIFAIGGLPLMLLPLEQARRVVAATEARLLTPLGLRSLAPGEPGYTGRYEGGVAQRDGVYHQGTVWPWLIGPFVEAWVRVRGDMPESRREARERFLTPLFEHLGTAGLGHVSEIADGDAPHTPRGCPFQAWSLGELLRLERRVL